MANILHKLNQEDVSRNLEILKQVVHDIDPDIAVDRGPFHDIVLYYAAVFTTANQHDLADAMRGVSLQRVFKQPDKSKVEHVDRLLSNWLITRGRGTTSSGLLTLVCADQMSFIVPPGTQFTANGHVFKTKSTYHVRTNSRQLEVHDRQLVKAPAGKWTVTIPVESVTTGTTSNIRRGTNVSFDKTYLPHVQKTYVTQDFTGGANEESNQQMLDRLVAGISSKTINNRLTIDALINSRPKFQNSAVSIIGFGDKEMLRDKHTLWPGAVGGRVDVYVKPRRSLGYKEIKTTGYRVESDAAGSTWEIKLDRMAAAGVLYVAAVYQDHGRCNVLSEVRAVDKADSRVDLHNELEAAFSSFQTITLRVADVEQKTTQSKTARFTVDVRYIDGIAALQAHVDDRNVANPASDLLVKAAVPCVTSVEIEIQRQPHDAQVDIEAIKESVATLINEGGFVGKLTVTSIMQAVTKHLSGEMLLRSTIVSGKLRYPDGTIEALTGSVLEVPHKSTHLVSPRTVAFFQDPSDVHIRVVTVDTPQT